MNIGWLDYYCLSCRPQWTLTFWVNATFLDCYWQNPMSNDQTKTKPRLKFQFHLGSIMARTLMPTLYWENVCQCECFSARHALRLHAFLRATQCKCSTILLDLWKAESISIAFFLILLRPPTRLLTIFLGK